MSTAGTGKVGEAHRIGFSVATIDGAPATGVAAIDFTTLVQIGAATTAPAVVELSGGLYYLEIPAAFSTTNGAGNYLVNVSVNSTSPAVVATMPARTIKFELRDQDDLAQPGDAMDLVTDAVDAAAVANGSIDAAAFAAGAINAAAIATDAITAAKIATDAIGASELAADAVAEIQAGLATSAEVVAVNADTDLLRHQGAVWIDTANGAAGTVVGTNGTPENPVDSLADAITLLGSTGLRELRIRKTGGGPLTLTQAFDDFRIVGIGDSVGIALNNQDVDGTMFIGCDLSGQLNGAISATNCDIDGVTDLDGHFNECHLINTNTVASGATVVFDRCASEVAGAAATPILDLQAAHVGGVSFHFRGYNGGLEIRNMDNAGDLGSVDMTSGQVILPASNTAGAVALRGVGQPFNSSAGTVVTDQMVRGTSVEAILVDTGTTIPARFTGIEGATFNTATDSLEAIRDRGDAAWTSLGIDYIEVRQGWALQLTNPAGSRLQGAVHLDNNGERVVLPGTARLDLTLTEQDGTVIGTPLTAQVPNADGWFDLTYDPVDVAGLALAGTVIIAKATITLSGVGSGTHNGNMEISIGDFV